MVGALNQQAGRLITDCYLDPIKSMLAVRHIEDAFCGFCEEVLRKITVLWIERDAPFLLGERIFFIFSLSANPKGGRRHIARKAAEENLNSRLKMEHFDPSGFSL